MSAICDAHKKVDVKLLYNSVHRKFNLLEIRYARENQHPSEWALRPPVEPPRRTGKKRGYGHKSEDQYVAVLFGLRLPLTVKPLSNHFEPFQIKWEVYFSKELCRSSLLCCRYDSACIWICVCIVVHGYTTYRWTMNRTLIFFRIVSTAFNAFIFASFPLFEKVLKLIFRYAVNLP